MPSKRRAALLFNPRAGAHRAKRLEAIRDALSGTFDLRFDPTESPEHCRTLAAQAKNDALDALFVLGGDGTLRVVASVLAGSGVAVGALPGGTTNVVALSLGLPMDPVGAARLLAAATPRETDLGRCGDQPFLMQVSGGLDATIMAAADPRLKKRLGKGAIAIAGFREWRRYRFPEIGLEVDGERLTVTGFVVSNLAQYAGGYEIVPGARADDRQLEILLFRGHRRRDAFGFAIDLVRGRHAARADVEIRRVGRVRVQSPAGQPLQYDGDPFVPSLPIDVELADERILLLTP
ncbi:MAG: diacylglycerol kinase family protein [Thermoanaerobaculia bacterium]